VNNKRGLSISNYQVAENELEFKHYSQAEKFAKRSIEISSQIGNKLWLVRGHELLARIYLIQRKLELSNAELQTALALKDQLSSSEKSGQIEELQTLYELKEKDNTIKLLEQERALRDQGMQNQRLLLTVLVVGMLLLIAVIFILTRLRSIQQKTNRDLQQKNSAIEQQREELQIQAEKLQELNQLQNKLFSVISHDLRGPISNVQTLLDLYTRNIVSPEEFIDVSTKLNRNLTITQQTLENLLSWAMSQMHGLKTEKRMIDVHQSIDEASHLLEEFVIRKSIRIERIREGSLLVYADPNQLQLILRNLLHNAIKFSKIGDVVTILAMPRDKFCFITIADTGIGMTSTEMDLLEGDRKHFSKPGTQQEKGTGLGLLLCKEFIERNGGNLTIESTADVGTKVIFSLELADNVEVSELSITNTTEEL
jgi:two-component system, sensor histidine kinase and response regulator